MDWIRKFRALVGSPEVAVERHEEQALQRSLGIVFPNDYLNWARSYESLEICNELIVWNWFSTRRDQITLEAASAMLKGIDLAQAISKDRIDVFDSQGFPIGPRPWIPTSPGVGGLFPWGTDANGTLYLWDAREADSDNWTVVMYDDRWREFDCGFVSFLVRLLSGEFIGSSLFMQDWPWIPAIREYEGETHGIPHWHVPERWRPYFAEYELRDEDIDYDWEDLSWVNQYR